MLSHERMDNGRGCQDEEKTMSTQEKTKDKTHYQVLGLGQDATPAEVRKAYLKAVRKTHPDINPGADPATFVTVSQAYEVLFDEGKRKIYDYDLRREGGSGSSSEPGSQSTSSDSGPRTPRSNPGPRPRGAKLHFPSREHRFEDAPRVDMGSGSMRMVVMLSSLGLALVAIGLIFFFPGDIDDSDFGKKLLNLTVLHYGSLGAMAAAIGLLFAFCAGHGIPASVAFVFAAVSLTPGVGLLFRHGENALTWVGASLAVLAGIGLFFGYTLPTKSGHVMGSDAKGINPEIFDYPIFGTPASGLENSNLDAGRVAVGAKGERMTAEGLKKLTKLAGLRIMHSMRFNPYTSGSGDIDHVLVYGRNIVLIDSKVWTPASYSFSTNESGEIVDDERIVEVRGDGSVGIREIKVARSIELWSKAFPSYNVVAWILVHASNTSSPMRFDNAGSSTMRMTDLETGLQEILDHLGNSTDDVVYSSAADMTTINRLHAS